MPAVTSPAHILLTGGSGFIGSAVLANLLDKSFIVRAVVRSNARAAPLKAKFKSYVESGSLTFIIVPDMTIPGAFDPALQGIDGVIHCASPMPSMDVNAHPQDLIRPAVAMNTGILKDAANVPSVKRVVLTSSVGTLYEPKDGKYLYTEKDWFDTAPKLAEKLGVKAPGMLKYLASKVLAERAAWQWVEDNKPSYELVTVLPPYVWGKSIMSNPEHIRPESSSFHLLAALSRAKAGQGDADAYLATTEFADVLDVAEGHVRALTTPAAAGERIAFRGGFTTWQDALDIINANPIPGVDVPEGIVGNGKKVVMKGPFTAAKSGRILGMKYRSKEQTIHDTVSQAVELGWSINDSSEEP